MIRLNNEQLINIDSLTEYNVEIVPKKSIRLFGICRNNQNYEPIPFDITFKIGDQAEYDSYNFSYTGEILAISPKTILIDASSTGRGNMRLKWHQFVWRNYKFDMEKITKRNNEVHREI